MFQNRSTYRQLQSSSNKTHSKKGNTSEIKNWRPISLLNCSYKILSRAINNRLKKCANRLTSRAQKGFSQTRQIQEVIINVIETIARSNATQTPIAILALDQTKAFDSISMNFFGTYFTFSALEKNLKK